MKIFRQNFFRPSFFWRFFSNNHQKNNEKKNLSGFEVKIGFWSQNNVFYDIDSTFKFPITKIFCLPLNPNKLRNFRPEICSKLHQVPTLLLPTLFWKRVLAQTDYFDFYLFPHLLSSLLITSHYFRMSLIVFFIESSLVYSTLCTVYSFWIANVKSDVTIHWDRVNEFRYGWTTAQELRHKFQKIYLLLFRKFPS